MYQHALLIIGLSLLLAACQSTRSPETATVPTTTPTTTTATDMTASSTPDAGTAPTTAPLTARTPTLLPTEDPPLNANQFTTDFSRHSVPYHEILAGGPPKDGIPAIDQPRFVSVAEADAWLEPQEPVILLQIGTATRAYPLQILTWHEIVNDTLDGVPVVVTFCPLCNTAIAFDRRVSDQVLDFGTTGLLRYSNLIMYDRQNESWWQQATGEAIAGRDTGSQLTFLPASIVAWAEFKASYPESTVLSRETGMTRNYGRNPYPGYDDVNQPPFLYQGPLTPGTLPATARVLTVDLDDEAVAYPYELLSTVGAINDTVGGNEIVVFWQAGTASALDATTVAGGRDVGTAAAFSRVVDERVLTFERADERLVDIETGSTWDVLGRALDGPLEGTQLLPVVAVNHLWFSWAAFNPDTRIFEK